MSFAFDPARLSDAELVRFVAFRRGQGDAADPKLLAALGEQERRRGDTLRFEASLRVIGEAARSRRFVAYKDIAEASGLVWSLPLRNQMRSHLDEVCQRMLGEADALISAIVVNAGHLKSGEMSPQSLRGFVDCAKRLGVVVNRDPMAFLREQQDRTFAWGTRTKGA